MTLYDSRFFQLEETFCGYNSHATVTQIQSDRILCIDFSIAASSENDWKAKTKALIEMALSDAEIKACIVGDDYRLRSYIFGCSYCDEIEAMQYLESRGVGVLDLSRVGEETDRVRGVENPTADEKLRRLMAEMP